MLPQRVSDVLLDAAEATDCVDEGRQLLMAKREVDADYRGNA